METTEENAELIINGDAFGLWEFTTIDGPAKFDVLLETYPGAEELTLTERVFILGRTSTPDPPDRGFVNDDVVESTSTAVDSAE